MVFCAAARAVYAPIPEQEQGKDLSLSLLGGISYNSNIFGSPTDDVGSLDFLVSPKIVFNSSLTDQTFFSVISPITFSAIAFCSGFRYQIADR